MRKETVFALFKRELLDIFRDKKTVAMMIVLPLLLYPTLIIGMVFVVNKISSSQEEKSYEVVFDTESTVEDELKQLLVEKKDEIDYTLTVLSPSQIEGKLEESSEDTGDDEKSAVTQENKRSSEESGAKMSVAKALTQKKISAYIKQTGDTDFEIRYLSANNDSTIAKNALSQLMGYYEDKLREKKIVEAGLLVKEIMEPVSIKAEDMSSAEESMGSQIGSLLPFFIITSVLLGAMYPAIDVTAGEKERGTLETLLTLPVSNLEMILSKFIAVALIACISAFLNIFSMGGAMVFLVSNSMAAADDLKINIDFSVFLPGIGFTLVVMIFFAMLVTAVCMCTCIFAKSFKEANNYSTPVMLIFMLGSYAALLPDVELSKATAVIPIVNVALLIKSLFGFSNDFWLYNTVLITNMGYSLIAIMILSRLYNSEAVLFSEGFTNVRIFDKRSDMKKGQMPGIGDVILVMTITLLLMIYVGSLAVAKFDFWGLGIQQGMVLAAPLLYAWYIKADKKKLFSLNKPAPSAVIGGLMMGAGLFVFSMILGNILSPLFPESTNGVTELDEWLFGNPTILIVLFTALMPAMGEELLFRGFLMGTLKEKQSAGFTIAVTAIIFAAYHMSILRFFTVGIIGLGFTIAAYRSRSIIVSMLMHFCNNLTAVLIGLNKEAVTDFTNSHEALLNSPLLTGAVIVLSAIFTVCGFYLTGKRAVTDAAVADNGKE
ncbi:MAG: ABC transporter permease [Lachnospiraceae bacterium]|nr:ABC transporter permease [Lachnospiraceae bacterium]